MVMILLFVSCCVYPQKSRMYYISSAVLFGTFSGLTEGLQYKENYLVKSKSDQARLNWWWHNTQLMERASAITLGITIADYSEFKWEKIVSSSLLSSAIVWIVGDGVINMVKNKPFFYISGWSTSEFDKFAKPEIKISLLAVAILVDAILLKGS